MVLRHYKNSRIVNINVNIVIASVISTFISLYPVHIIGKMMGSPLKIALSSFATDAIVDLIVFFALQAFVNWGQFNSYRPSKTLVKDTARLQAHRIFLAVIFFVVAVSSHYFLIEAGAPVTASFLLSYTSALVITRTIHTLYGLKTGLFEPLSNK